MIYYKLIPPGQISYIHYDNPNDCQVYKSDQNRWINYIDYHDKIWPREDVLCLPEDHIMNYGLNKLQVHRYITHNIISDRSYDYLIAYRPDDFIGFARCKSFALTNTDPPFYILQDFFTL